MAYTVIDLAEIPEDPAGLQKKWRKCARTSCPLDSSAPSLATRWDNRWRAHKSSEAR